MWETDKATQPCRGTRVSDHFTVAILTLFISTLIKSQTVLTSCGFLTPMLLLTKFWKIVVTLKHAMFLLKIDGDHLSPLSGTMLHHFRTDTSLLYNAKKLPLILCSKGTIKSTTYIIRAWISIVTNPVGYLPLIIIIIIIYSNLHTFYNTCLHDKFCVSVSYTNMRGSGAFKVRIDCTNTSHILIIPQVAAVGIYMGRMEARCAAIVRNYCRTFCTEHAYKADVRATYTSVIFKSAHEVDQPVGCSSGPPL